MERESPRRRYHLPALLHAAYELFLKREGGPKLVTVLVWSYSCNWLIKADALQVDV